jgi:predicted DNA binding CopG/RHH family protein
MLQTMQQPGTSEPSPTFAGPTFAGMLAALAAPGQKRPPARDLDGLEDDVATLSYERALRVHTRYRAPDPTDRSLTQPLVERLHFDELHLDAEDSAAQPATAQFAFVPEAHAEAEAANLASTLNEVLTLNEASTANDRNLKCASITIRVSKAECAQLRARAAEAGLTISAYLRSCTLEAESLRAQVKDALAQLRSEEPKELTPREIRADAAPARGSWLGRLRFWPYTQEKQESEQG